MRSDGVVRSKKTMTDTQSRHIFMWLVLQHQNRATCQPVSTTILSPAPPPDKQSVINGHLIVFITDVISVCSDRQSLSFVYQKEKIGRRYWEGLEAKKELVGG